MLPDNALDKNDQIIQYLMNFWEPSIDDTLDQRKIKKISKQYPSQIQFHDDNNWYFVQDYKWSPSLNEAIISTCKSLDIGYNFENDELYKNRIFRPIPKSFQELYETIVEYRTENIMQLRIR